MGEITRFRFDEAFCDRFPVFVETGTGLGFGLSMAAEAGFTELHSIDIDERLYNNATRIFADDPRVKLHLGNSGTELEQLCWKIPSDKGVVFWLDAHFPGSDFFGEYYDAVADEHVRLPLLDELEAIRAGRPWAKDIVIIDDLRIWEDGDYESGNLPKASQGLPYKDRNTGFLDRWAAEKGFKVYRHYQDGGYMVLAPDKAPLPGLVHTYTVEDYVRMARRHVELSNHGAARRCYDRVLDVSSNFITQGIGLAKVARGEACRFMAADALAHGRDGTATDWFLEAAASDPLAIEYRLDLIYQILIPTRALDLAFRQAETVTRIAPDDPVGWRALAAVQKEAAVGDKALEAIDKALELAPNEPDSIRLKAMLVSDMCDQVQARIFYQRLATEFPKHKGNALLGLSICSAREGNHAKALELMEDAIKTGVNPADQNLAEWNRAEMLLTLGRYAEGWKEHAKRFTIARRVPGVGPAGDRFLRPMWSPDRPPERVHVHSEQGYGDVICMARYAPLLRDMGHDVRFEVPPELHELMAYSLDGIKVVPRAADFPGSLGLEDFDSHVPTMCFPGLFGTTTENVPWGGPFLKADPKLVARFRNVVPGRKRVGLCYKAGVRPGLWHNAYAKFKSVDLALLTPLLANKDVFWQLLDFEDNKMSFAESAALLANLDLLITVDTACAHLAGALGLPTWLLQHIGGSWHWMTNVEGTKFEHASPWYPSVRLFRQQKHDDWAPVIDKVTEELRCVTS